MNKSKIRKDILKIRKKNFFNNLNIDFNKILKLLNLSKFKGKTIGGYYPYNYELDCMPILKKFEKKKFVISLPKIRKNYKMDFFEWSSKEPLSINKYGIPEPTSNKIKFPDVLLVPLLAFDKNLNRVGYGGGYYDRYISKIKKKKFLLTIGLAYSFQKVNKISAKKYDIKLDYIITEKKK